MKRKIIFLILVYFLNFSTPVYSIPIAPIKTLIQKLGTIFDDLFKSSDDVLKQTNKVDETISSSTNKLSDSELILSKINNETHNSHLNTALNENRKKIKIVHGLKLRNLGKDIIENADNLIDVYDLGFSTADQNIRSSPYFIKNWVGKIYRPRTEKYDLSKEKGYLLVCSNRVEVFYFTILLDNMNDINRVFITDHKYFYAQMKPLKRQELLILRDDAEIKVMSTKPKNKDSINFDLFKISRDGRFQHKKNVSILSKQYNQGKTLNKNIKDFCKKYN